jgi:hypothetical protein
MPKAIYKKRAVFTLRLQEELLQRLEREAENRGTTVTMEIIRCIEVVYGRTESQVQDRSVMLAEVRDQVREETRDFLAQMFRINREELGKEQFDKELAKRGFELSEDGSDE